MNVVHVVLVLVTTEGAKGFRGHHFREPDNGIERRAQLVAHGGEEFRFHPIGGLCFVAGLDEFRLTLLQQGNVRFDDNGATIGGVAFTGHHPFTVTGLFGYRGRGFAVAGQRSGTKLFLSE